jgi:hypothetical protein
VNAHKKTGNQTVGSLAESNIPKAASVHLTVMIISMLASRVKPYDIFCLLLQNKSLYFVRLYSSIAIICNFAPVFEAAAPTGGQAAAPSVL